MKGKLNNKLILVVEDEDFSYWFIESALLDENAKVVRAEDGQEAIDKFQYETFDLVLMDIQLPKVNGYEATKQLKKINKFTPVIAQTAYALKKQKRKCLKSGCNDYISKPYDSKQLLNLVRKYI